MPVGDTTLRALELFSTNEAVSTVEIGSDFTRPVMQV